MTDIAEPGAAPSGNAGPRVRVWDPLVRLMHWGLVAAFALAWLSAEASDLVHQIAGYAVAALVGLRLVWGLVGTRHARFAWFLRGPGATLSYLGDMARGTERRHLGHNPAGAAMIVALLVALSGTALTGWLAQEPSRMAALPRMPQIVAPAFADDDGDDRGRGAGAKDALAELHEAFANLLLVLVALHVGGVALASFRHRENLVRAMITGDKRAPGFGDIP